VETRGQLKRISLKGFRSIREMNLPLGPINILIGPNGAGKSNFISFFRFMKKLLDRELQLHVRTQLNGADRTLFFGRKRTEILEIELEVPPVTYTSILTPSVDDTLVFVTEYLTAAPEVIRSGRMKITMPGALESHLPPTSAFEELPFFGQISKSISEWFVYHFHDTSDKAKVKTSYSIHANARLMAHGENLAAFLYGIRNETAYRRIVKAIQRVAPFFHDFQFQPEPNDMIRLRWKHVGSDDYFDATMLSDGTLRFMLLATLLLQPKPPGMLILDEPELGLHPFAMQLLAGMIKSVSDTTQIIASTQSVTLINQFSWQDLVVVEQADHATNLRRLKEEQVADWLEKYRLGDVWEMNALGGTPE
jgi:predicted ATPase